MQKNYRLLLTLLFCITISIGMFAQETTTYKDVVLDGKPARLNTVTGEVTLINPEDKKTEQTTAVVEKSKIETVASVQPEVIKADYTDASDFYVVQKGDNLLKLSERFKVSLRDLKDANNLETTLIRPGQKLRIKNFDNSNRSNLDSETQNSTALYSEATDVHLIKKGETLYGLSQRYGMSVSTLKQKNKLTSNLIKAGETLYIGHSESSNEIKNSSVWIVSKGDTLYSIARKNGTTVDAIKVLNGLTSNLISIGQKLQLK